MSKTVLILGGSGRFGRHATTAFRYNGWEVRQFDRQTESLWDAAWGADVIVNAWNPPYPQWTDEVPRLTREVIEVATAARATVILPGNVYVFGEETKSPWSEATPHQAQNPLGRIRIEMEEAYRQSGVRTIILRAGDFIDTEGSGNWFDKILTASLNRDRFVYPGATDIPHAWAWLPDLADAAVALAEKRHELSMFEDVPFTGYTLTGRQLSEAVSDAIRRPVALKRMNWLPLRLVSPFWAMGRSLLEMRYLWDTAHQLDSAKFNALVPHFRATDLEEALGLALKHHIHPDQPVAGHGLAFGS